MIYSSSFVTNIAEYGFPCKFIKHIYIQIIENMNIEEETLDDDLLDEGDFLSGISDEEDMDGLPEFDIYDDIDE